MTCPAEPASKPDAKPDERGPSRENVLSSSLAERQTLALEHLCDQIALLVQQNAALIEMLLEDADLEDGEPAGSPQYLNGRR